jgi:restriction system protein
MAVPNNERKSVNLIWDSTIASSDQFKESMLPDSAINKLYDPLIYRIALRTMHELYIADVAEALDSIIFNGWVTTTDLGTGHRSPICILSVQSQKEEFKKINLRDVDPKTCFKKLKGISSSKLHGMAAIPPILTMSREDSRFVQAHDVAHLIDDSVNIAAMDWQEFEHLIREIFEKEFSDGGGEVKITQASRDRGVGAIAFDPDPIKGGKIVIQAKRYTNTVEVAAVRDLYGTVINEGAMKGILVTTSDYGPDAYSFAQGKPLSLISGGNLLAMLAKHGHKAKIDLEEAKTILS